VLPLLGDLGQVQLRARFVHRRESGDEVVLCLHHVGGFDREQLLAASDGVAGLDQQLHDPTRIWREDQRRTVFVDRDFSFGHVLGAKHVLLDRLYRQRRPLGFRRIEHPR